MSDTQVMLMLLLVYAQGIALGVFIGLAKGRRERLEKPLNIHVSVSSEPDDDADFWKDSGNN